MTKVKLDNKKFNRLAFIQESEPIIKNYGGTIHKTRRGLFKCDCGNQKLLRINCVVSGITKSCGCYNSELTVIRNKKTAIHNLTGTRFFKIYDSLSGRTKFSNHKSNKYYYGKGIRNEWKSMSEFANDMYKSYLDHCELYGEKNTSLDRIDYNGNYSKQNCRWLTLREQSYNKSSTLLIEYNGKKYNLLELERMSGVRARLIYKRYHEGKKPIQECLK